MSVKLSLIGVLLAVAMVHSMDEDYCKEGSLTSHAVDCNAFYICSGGEWTLLKCPQGLHFHEQLQICDYPDNAQCAIVGPPEESKNDCPAYGSGADLLAHPKCDHYYMCVYGVPHERRCGKALHFKADAQYCDWPENAQCVDGAAGEQPGAVLLPIDDKSSTTVEPEWNGLPL